MVNVVLVNKLKERIETLVKDFVLPTNLDGHDHKAPQVVSGFLSESKHSPVADPQEIKAELPAVVVRFRRENDGRQANIVKIRVIVITYSEDEQNGWIDSLNVANRIKIGLKRDPIIDERFQIDDESFEMEQPDEQPFPEWATYIAFDVLVPQVQSEFDWGVFYK
jgi:hypothetical protein